MEVILVSLTTDELNSIAYALIELASKRQEQAIDYKSKDSANESTQLRNLAERMRKLKNNKI